MTLNDDEFAHAETLEDFETVDGIELETNPVPWGLNNGAHTTFYPQGDDDLTDQRIVLRTPTPQRLNVYDESDNRLQVGEVVERDDTITLAIDLRAGFYLAGHEFEFAAFEEGQHVTSQFDEDVVLTSQRGYDLAWDVTLTHSGTFDLGTQPSSTQFDKQSYGDEFATLRAITVESEADTEIEDLGPISKEPVSGIHNIRKGRTMVVRGTTNRDPAETLMVVEATDGPDEGLAAFPSDTATDWDSDGVWQVELPITEEVVADTYTIEVEDGVSSDEVEVTVLEPEPAEFNILSTDFVDEAEPGETIESSATVAHDGDRTQTLEASYQFDGALHDTESVEIRGGEVETVQFEYTVPAGIEGGVYKQMIDVGDEQRTADLTVAPEDSEESTGEPAEFEIQRYEFENSAHVGAAVVAAAVVANTGDLPGSKEIEYAFADEVLDSEVVDLDGGEVEEVALSGELPEDLEPGDYEQLLELDGEEMSELMSVVEAEDFDEGEIGDAAAEVDDVEGEMMLELADWEHRNDVPLTSEPPLVLEDPARSSMFIVAFAVAGILLKMVPRAGL